MSRVCAWILAGVLMMPGRVANGQAPVADARPGTDRARADEMLARLVTVDLDHVSVRQAINAIATSVHVRVVYRGRLDTVHAAVSLRAKKMPLGAALARVLAGTNLRGEPQSDDILAIKPAADVVPADGGSVSGSVRDSKSKRPLRGVAVRLDETGAKTVTGEDGAFLLTGVSAGTHHINFRLIGYGKQSHAVSVNDGAVATIDVALEANVSMLNQVVVTGTVVETELKAIPNAITVITAKQLEERGITRIDQLFRGEVPGLFASNQGTRNGFDNVVMYSRGATALNGQSAGTDLYTNPIKTYVDGVELASPAYLSQIDPKSIERIEILTGPQASTIYGSNAINGVMQIFTKRGTTARPQLTLNLLSGWVENNFRSTRTPEHNYDAQLSGVEGRISYNAGTSWNYIGPWTPAKKSNQLGAFGGARIEIPTHGGPVTADVSYRRTTTANRQRGSGQQTSTAFVEDGWFKTGGATSTGSVAPTTYTMSGQTIGVTFGYTPVSWWSHQLRVGQDVSEAENAQTAPGYGYISAYSADTMLFINNSQTTKKSILYTNTLSISPASSLHATVTTGADSWQTLTTTWGAQPQTLIGNLGSPSVNRLPDHNTGAFVQAQIAVADQLYLTYGMRAEWNPNFGDNAQPNLSPRYGLAYSREMGPLTAKLRGSYGRSTRPPSKTAKGAVTANDAGYATSLVPAYGNFDVYKANADLGPEHQQGGEAGLELYFGNRATLVVTRYNQTVDGLIAAAPVDSVRSIIPNPTFSGLTCAQWLSYDYTGYCTSQDAMGFTYVGQNQYLNIASIRNQGWELQGSVVTGPISTHGTYSWTKSRVLGVNPKYRAFFTRSGFPQYQPGATFMFLPEHTWALDMTYARSGTTVALNVSGTGSLRSSSSQFSYERLGGSIRLYENWLTFNNSGYTSTNDPYAIADLIASHRILPNVEGLLQVHNLMNHYANDFGADYATMGRQTQVGLRVHL